MIIKFAIIGCGRISRRHVFEMQKYGNLVAICDIIPEKADVLAAETGANAYYSIDSLLENEKELTLVAVCTPNGLHAEHSIKALQAGYHVLCEKPLCIDPRAGRQMIETAKFSNRKLWVVKSTRYNPSVLALREAIISGKTGEIFSFQLNCCWNRPPSYYADDWRGTLFPDGGTLYTQFSHYIDVLCWLFGTPRSVSGYRKNACHKTELEFEDMGVASLEMSNGTLGSIHWSVNAVQKNMEVSLMVSAEKGTIRLGGSCMQFIEYQQWTDDQPLSAGDGNLPNNYGHYQGSMSNHDLLYKDLADILTNGAEIPLPLGADGLATVETIHKIYTECPLI